MIRLPSVSSRRVISILKKAGFTEHHQTGSHVTLKHSLTDLRVVVPLHRGDLKRGTLHGILSQAGISEDDFRNLL